MSNKDNNRALVLWSIDKVAKLDRLTIFRQHLELRGVEQLGN